MFSLVVDRRPVRIQPMFSPFPGAPRRGPFFGYELSGRSVDMFVRLLNEADAAAHRALRIMSIQESPQLSSPQLVMELAIYQRIGAGALMAHAAGGHERTSVVSVKSVKESV